MTDIITEIIREEAKLAEMAMVTAIETMNELDIYWQEQANEIKLLLRNESKAVIAIGNALIEAKEKLPMRDYVTWYQSCGLDRKRVSYYIRRAKGESLEDCLIVRQSDDWYTPEPIVNLIWKFFNGDFLDVASCEIANTVVKASYYYDKEDNGLVRDWYGKVFVNPPYDNIAAWIEKLLAEYQARHLTEAIALLPVGTDTAWFQDYLFIFPTCFIRGRLKYWCPGKHSTVPTFPSMLVYIGKRSNEFMATFNDIGSVK